MSVITLEHVRKLHEDGLYDNIKMLVPFLLSDSSTPLKDDSAVVSRRYQLHVYYGNALYDDEQYMQAVEQYNEAIKIKKHIERLKLKSPPCKINLTLETEVKYKLFLCYKKMDDTKEALAVLENIAPKSRTPKMNMMLGKLYEKNGMKRSAITCFKEVTRSSPGALEAAMCLLNLGVPLHEISSLITTDGFVPPEWYMQYLKAYSFKCANKHSKSIQIYKTLEEQTFKENLHLLSMLAESSYRTGDCKMAIKYYDRIRSLDKHYMNGIDIYSQLLAEEKEKEKLENVLISSSEGFSFWPCQYKLAQELSCLYGHRTESWLALSYYCSCTNQASKAVYFAQKAHMSDVTNVPALVLKATLLLSLNKYQEAIIHYREAIRLSPNELKPYEGLVECYIGSERLKEAMTVARSAHKSIGANARTVTLCAKVYSLEPQSREKCKAMLKKALSSDSTYLPAVYMLIELLMKEEDYETASEILEKQLENQQTPRLYCLYGACLKELGKNSVEMFNKALRLDPDDISAMEGIQSIERDATGDLDMSSIGLHEPRDRSSIEDLDGIGDDIQWNA